MLNIVVFRDKNDDHIGIVIYFTEQKDQHLTCDKSDVVSILVSYMTCMILVVFLVQIDSSNSVLLLCYKCR